MTLDIETVWKILGVVFACGMVWAKLESIQRDIKRLERKQEKYNQLQERTHDLEMWKQYHLEQHKGAANATDSSFFN